MFHGTPSKVSKFAPEEDVISSMPDCVITNILDRLPIQYAVRTDVLSKNGTLKWNLLTQLVFDKNFFKLLRLLCDSYRNRDEPYKFNERDISRLLFHLKGPITKFVAYIPYEDDEQLLYVKKDIYQWVLILSRKGIKDFTLVNKCTTPLFKLPTQLVSCTELKHLKLKGCCFPVSPSFCGFPNLLSLDLHCVLFGSYKCRWELMARCPLLEMLKIGTCGDIGELELNEIAKLVKLKMLHLKSLKPDSLAFITKLSALLKLRELTLEFCHWMSLAEDGVERFPAAFLCLETLTLSNVQLDYDKINSFVFEMICGSPNLQTLRITVNAGRLASRIQEMFHGTPSKVSKFAQGEDFISSMPDNVITNILDRLPIQDAVKTDVLSKYWRLKWTLFTQLVFDENFFDYLKKINPDEPYKYNGKDISRLLLHLKGPITKFVLYIPYNNQLIDGKDLYHCVLFLSRKGIKDFTLLYKPITTLFKLPTQLSSCTELEHLKLEYCSFHLAPSFSGFPNLLSLDLRCVSFGSYKCREFLARCPSLEILKISMLGVPTAVLELRMNQIAKLVNLKTVHLVHLNLLRLHNLILITKLSPLPKLQELTLDFDYRRMLSAEDKLKFHFAFPCLKTLTLYYVHFDCDIRRSFVFKLIFGCPNLKTLDITVTYTMVMSHHQNLLPHIQSMGHSQLQSAVLAGFRGSENEVYLIEFLLARSPLLKKIGIGLDSSKILGGADGKFMFANKLPKLYRASPVVKIDLY